MCLNEVKMQSTYIQWCEALLSDLTRNDLNKHLIESGIINGCWTYTWPLCVKCGPLIAPDLEKIIYLPLLRLYCESL